MEPKRNAPPGGRPGGAKSKTMKRRSNLDSCAAEIRQGCISLFDGNRLAARIVFADKSALAFVANGNGLQQVGGVYPSRKRALAAVGGML